MIKGTDISKYQGDVDFGKLKSETDFVIIRSSYGSGYKDANFEKNRDAARLAGLCIGFYHYAYPQFNVPEAEADWFCKIVSCQPGEIIALDFEESYPNPVAWSKRFLDKCTSNMGFKPLIYLNMSLVKSFDWSPIINAGYGLWLALWDYNPDSVHTDVPWTVTVMRQFSNKGSVAGMSPVDLDVFYGDVATFKKYGNPPPPPVSESTPPLVITDQTIIPMIIDSQGKPMEVQAIRSMLADQEQRISNLLTQVDQLKKDIDDATLAHSLPPTFQQIHNVIYGSGFWWTKWSKIKTLIPR